MAITFFGPYWPEVPYEAFKRGCQARGKVSRSMATGPCSIIWGSTGSAFMGSWNSLVERVRSLSSEPLPPNEFGREQLAFMSGMVGRAVQFRESHPELEHRWMDVNYVDLVEEGSL